MEILLAAIVTGLFVVAAAFVTSVPARRARRASDRVHAQLVPNGGKTLRDCLDRIEWKVSGIDHRVGTLGMRLEEHLMWTGDDHSGVPPHDVTGIATHH